jgi:hypothetical protein
MATDHNPVGYVGLGVTIARFLLEAILYFVINFIIVWTILARCGLYNGMFDNFGLILDFFLTPGHWPGVDYISECLLVCSEDLEVW